jgi:hypothetical protein
MASSRLHRLTTALVLGAILMGAWATGAQASILTLDREPRTLRMQPDVLSCFWGVLKQVYRKTGCSIDPHGGLCESNTGPKVPAQGDTGCSLDPHGRCPGNP